MKPEMDYIEANCFKWTFQDKKVKKAVESVCEGTVLNLCAGKTRLNVNEVRVDISNEFKPDHNMSAGEFLKDAIKNGWTFKTIIYDPPWNDRKAKEFYNGKKIGKFTRLKDQIVSILDINGKIVSVGYEITNFGLKRDMRLEKFFVINPKGEIRPFFISVERKRTIPITKLLGDL